MVGDVASVTFLNVPHFLAMMFLCGAICIGLGDGVFSFSSGGKADGLLNKCPASNHHFQAISADFSFGSSMLFQLFTICCSLLTAC